MSTAIEFNNVSKQYKLGLVSTKTLSHDLNRWWQTKILRKDDPYLKIGSVNDRSAKADSDYVWALKDIDFKVEQGDVVGIIGKNGAGKSTLLKLLSRVTNPTTGTIRARGRIASLLEVGTGFHPELTGRENIYMNGSIMGMNKAEITRKLDEIVAFSGCERYIDTPVKRYSSGMTVRLGFAIAAHLDPEILVVDEVLAVGDAEFQKKAIGKMQDVSKGEGRTVLFVSHNMTAVKNLCKSGILIENGCVKDIGGIDSVVQHYLMGESYNGINNHECQLENAPGEEGIKVILSKIITDNNIITTSNDIKLVYKFWNEIDNRPIAVNPHLYDVNGVCIFNASSGTKYLSKGYHQAEFEIPANLLKAGNYYVDNMYISRNTCLYNHRHSHSFEIINEQTNTMGNYLGVIYPSFVKSKYK